MTHVAMARTAIAEIRAFMTSLQGHREACEQEKCVAKKAISININCEEQPRDELGGCTLKSGLGVSASSFTPASAPSHRRKRNVTADCLILLVLSEGFVSAALQQRGRPQGHIHSSAC